MEEMFKEINASEMRERNCDNRCRRILYINDKCLPYTRVDLPVPAVHKPSKVKKHKKRTKHVQKATETFQRKNVTTTASQTIPMMCYHPPINFKPKPVEWLTVTGYPDGVEHQVLTFMRSIGPIVDYVIRQSGNWIFVKYEFNEHYYKALCLNHHEILSGKIRIVVYSGATEDVLKCKVAIVNNVEVKESQSCNLNSSREATMSRASIFENILHNLL